MQQYGADLTQKRCSYWRNSLLLWKQNACYRIRKVALLIQLRQESLIHYKGSQPNCFTHKWLNITKLCSDVVSYWDNLLLWVQRRLSFYFTVKGWVRSQVSPCEIRGGKSGIRTNYLRVILFPPPINILPGLHTHIYILVAITRRAKRRSLGTFRKTMIFEIAEKKFLVSKKLIIT